MATAMVTVMEARHRAVNLVKAGSVSHSCRAILILLVGGATAGSSAQDLQINSFVELMERHTDNVLLAEDSLAKNDWITDLATGFNLRYKSARALAFIDYRVDKFYHNRQTALNRTENRLNSRTTLEAIEKWLFVDVSASITQENRTPFGVAGTSDFSSNPINRVETTNYRVAPYIRGVFANFADYQFRLSSTETRVSDGSIPSTRATELTAFARNSQTASGIGWSAEANALSLKPVGIDERSDSRLRASLIANVTPQIHFSLGGGVEQSNLENADKKNTITHNIGLEWSPNERTKLAAVMQKRFFGYDHLVAIGHRTRLTAWRLSSNREVMFLGSRLLGEQSGSVQGLLLDLLAATISDPVGRAEAAQKKFEQSGTSAVSGIKRDALATQPYLSRRHEASVVLLGPRNTLTLNGGWQEQRAFSTREPSLPGAGTIVDTRQTGVNATWAYRLTRASNINATFSRLQTKSLTGLPQSTTQLQKSLLFVTKPGQHTTVSIGLRQNQFENSIIANSSERVFACSVTVAF